MEAAKVALEQAEMSAVVAATECMNMQKASPHAELCLESHCHCSQLRGNQPANSLHALPCCKLSSAVVDLRSSYVQHGVTLSLVSYYSTNRECADDVAGGTSRESGGQEGTARAVTACTPPQGDPAEGQDRLEGPQSDSQAAGLQDWSALLHSADCVVVHATSRPLLYCTESA